MAMAKVFDMALSAQRDTFLAYASLRTNTEVKIEWSPDSSLGGYRILEGLIAPDGDGGPQIPERGQVAPAPAW